MKNFMQTFLQEEDRLKDFNYRILEGYCVAEIHTENVGGVKSGTRIMGELRKYLTVDPENSIFYKGDNNTAPTNKEVFFRISSAYSECTETEITPKAVEAMPGFARNLAIALENTLIEPIGYSLIQFPKDEDGKTAQMLGIKFTDKNFNAGEEKFLIIGERPYYFGDLKTEKEIAEIDRAANEKARLEQAEKDRLEQEKEANLAKASKAAKAAKADAINKAVDNPPIQNNTPASPAEIKRSPELEDKYAGKTITINAFVPGIGMITHARKIVGFNDKWQVQSNGQLFLVNYSSIVVITP